MKTLLYARSRSYRGSPRPVLYGLLALLTVVFAAGSAAGQATALVPEPQTAAHAQAVDQAREFVREWMAEKNLPGVSVAVGLDGELVWAEGFGWADLEQRVPVMPLTRFRIGSASKGLTSAAGSVRSTRLRLPLFTHLPRGGLLGNLYAVRCISSPTLEGFSSLKPFQY